MSNRKCITIMKKLFYSILAVAALVACAKEKEAPVEVAKAPVSTHKETIVATFSSETKTAYSNYSKFSWVAGDKIWVGVVKDGATNPLNSDYYEFVTFTAKSSGATVEFEGEVPDNYRPNAAQIAYYPGDLQDPWYETNQSGFACRLPSVVYQGVEVPANNENTNFLASAEDNPLSFIPLIGSKKDDGTFEFKTAVSIVKFQLTDLDKDACCLTLTTPSDAGYLANYFIVDEDRYIKEDKILTRGTSKYGIHYVNYYFKRAADGSATVFVAVPVGTLKAGTTFAVKDASGNELFSAEFKKDVAVERNKIVSLAPIKAKVDWVSLGTGKFADVFVWSYGGFTNYVDVEIKYDAANKKYQIVNPYGTAISEYEYTPGGTVSPASAFLTLTEDEEGNVTYDDHITGVYYGKNWTNGIMIIDPYYFSSNYPQSYADMKHGDNFVAKYDASGVAANIVLSPVYYAVSSNYWTGYNYIWSRTIQIIFPGARQIDPTISVAYSSITDSTPAQPVASVKFEMGDIYTGASLAIAASEADAEAIFAAGNGVAVTASGTYSVNLPANAESGDYYVFAKPTGAANVAAGRTVSSDAFNYQSVADWTSIGTGKYYDYYIWNAGGFGTDFVDVDIQVNAAGQYKLNPYAAVYAANSYTPAGTVTGPFPLILTVEADDYVSYDETAIGYFNPNWGSDGVEMGICSPYYYSSNYPSIYGDFGKGNNFVVKKKADGTPANIIISPIYVSMTTSSWTGSNFIWSNPIQIIFPGESEVDINAEIQFVEIEDDSPAQPIAKIAAHVGADIAQIKLVIAKTQAEAEAALAADQNVTVATTTDYYSVNLPANASSGDYYAFGQIVAADGISTVVNALISTSDFHYDNPDEDLGLDVSILYGDWEGDITRNQSGNFYDDTFTISFGESDSQLEGNVLITKMMGYAGNGTGYMNFDTATGTLTLADQLPCVTRSIYLMGLRNADSTDDFVFRYLPATDQITLTNIEFVYFGAYDSTTLGWLGHWGYFYGPIENNYKLLLSRVKNDSSAPKNRKRAVSSSAPQKGMLPLVHAKK